MIYGNKFLPESYHDENYYEKATKDMDNFRAYMILSKNTGKNLYSNTAKTCYYNAKKYIDLALEKKEIDKKTYNKFISDLESIKYTYRSDGQISYF